jgi:hypothetical protein
MKSEERALKKPKKTSQLYNRIMTATLTYTLVLAAIYFGIKAIELIEQKD